MSGIKTITGILSIIGLCLITLIIFENHIGSDDGLLSYWSLGKLKDKQAAFAVLFFATTFFGLKLEEGWASLCGLPFLAIVILPFSAESRYQGFEDHLETVQIKLDNVESKVSDLDQKQNDLFIWKTTVPKGFVEVHTNPPQTPPEPEDEPGWWDEGDYDLGASADKSICFIASLKGDFDKKEGEVRLYEQDSTWHLSIKDTNDSVQVKIRCVSLG